MFLASSINIRTRTKAKLGYNPDLSINTKTTVDEWIEKANKYECVRDVLHFFNDKTWWNLYKIYELICEDMGGRKNLYQYIPKPDISLFTQAAQSRDLLGDNARHASKKKYKPPKENFTLDQASLLLEELFRIWINTKK